MTLNRNPVEQLTEPDIYSGQRFGDIVVGDVLSQGCTRNSYVRHASNDKTGEKLVLKCIRKCNVSQDYIEQECLNMTLFNHPNIISGNTFFDTPQFRCFFMKYADGGDLLDYVLGMPQLDENVARQLANQMITAIDYIHQMGYVHRDIKLENFFVTSDLNSTLPLIILADLGYTKQLMPDEEFPGNQCIGSYPYMAPELFLQQKYSFPVDIWAFGCTLFCLLTKRTPFPDTKDPDFTTCVLTGQFQYELLDDCSEDAKDLVNRCLEIDPARRPTAHEVATHPWFMSVEMATKQGLEIYGGAYDDADEINGIPLF